MTNNDNNKIYSADLRSKMGLLLKILLITFMFILLTESKPMSPCPQFCKCNINSNQIYSASCSEIVSKNTPYSNIHALTIKPKSSSGECYIFQDITAAFPQLNFLYLTSCSLLHIPISHIKPMFALVEIDLSNNRLTKINPNLFSTNTKLRYVNFANNPIQVHNKRPFLMSKSIWEINMSNCSLTDIPIIMFKGLPNLKYLTLSNNKIKTLALHSLPYEIKTLNLARNNIVNVPTTELLRVQNHLKEINLSENPINCTCDLMGFQNWVSGKGVIFLNNIICSFPREYIGEKLINIPPYELCEAKLQSYETDSLESCSQEHICNNVILPVSDGFQGDEPPRNTDNNTSSFEDDGPDALYENDEVIPVVKKQGKRDSEGKSDEDDDNEGSGSSTLETEYGSTIPDVPSPVPDGVKIEEPKEDREISGQKDIGHTESAAKSLDVKIQEPKEGPEISSQKDIGHTETSPKTLDVKIEESKDEPIDETKTIADASSKIASDISTDSVILAESKNVTNDTSIETVTDDPAKIHKLDESSEVVSTEVKASIVDTVKSNTSTEIDVSKPDETIIHTEKSIDISDLDSSKMSESEKQEKDQQVLDVEKSETTVKSDDIKTSTTIKVDLIDSEELETPVPDKVSTENYPSLTDSKIDDERDLKSTSETIITTPTTSSTSVIDMTEQKPKGESSSETGSKSIESTEKTDHEKDEKQVSSSVDTLASESDVRKAVEEDKTEVVTTVSAEPATGDFPVTTPILLDPVFNQTLSSNDTTGKNATGALLAMDSKKDMYLFGIHLNYIIPCAIVVLFICICMLVYASQRKKVFRKNWSPDDANRGNENEGTELQDVSLLSDNNRGVIVRNNRRFPDEADSEQTQGLMGDQEDPINKSRWDNKDIPLGNGKPKSMESLQDIPLHGKEDNCNLQNGRTSPQNLPQNISSNSNNNNNNIHKDNEVERTTVRVTMLPDSMPHKPVIINRTSMVDY